MKNKLSSVVVLLLAVSGFAWGDSQEKDKKAAKKDPLPHAKTMEWDLEVFEESPTFKVVKREVKGNRVTWVLENQRNLGTEITFGYQAALFDEDGVKLGTIEIETDPFLLNMPKGERNRFNLHLPPQEKLKDVRKVVIKNGLYRN
jgi:hypothetical protein